MADHTRLMRAQLVRRLRRLQAERKGGARRRAPARPVFDRLQRRLFEASPCPMRIFERKGVRTLFLIQDPFLLSFQSRNRHWCRRCLLHAAHTIAGRTWFVLRIARSCPAKMTAFPQRV